jgi:hypothetical protein
MNRSAFPLPSSPSVLLPVRVSRNEWRWVLAWGLLLLFITSLPYLMGVLLSTPDSHFGGFIMGAEDGNSYVAKMEQGRSGAWLFHLVYTSEPHQGGLFYLHYILLGKVAGLLGVHSLLVYHLGRLFTNMFALGSFYLLTAWFTPHLMVRRVAFLLFGFTAGLGWLWMLLGVWFGFQTMPIDLWVPEASFFLAALTFPHYTFSLGLQLWVIIGTLWYLDRGHWLAWLLAAAAGLLVTLVHPYKLVIVMPIFGVYVLWRWYRGLDGLWQPLLRLLLVLLPTLPYLVYGVVVFSINPAFRAWRLQNEALAPAPYYIILGYGWLLLPAVMGVWHYRPWNPRPGLLADNGHSTFLVVWLVVTPLLVYLPSPLQRRFLDGYQPVLAIFGAVGIVWLLQRVQHRLLRGLVLAALVIPLVLTNLLLVVGPMLTLPARYASVYHSAGQQTAFRWLADNSNDAEFEVVLTAFNTGNVLPVYAPQRVMVGHGLETINFAEKQQLVAHFFTAAAGDRWRQQLLAQHHISYVYYGPYEQALGDFDPAVAAYLDQVYTNGPVTIYRVVD